MGGDWRYALTERTSFTLSTERRLEESVFANNAFFVANMATLSAAHTFTQLPKLRTSARFTVGDNDYPEKSTVGGVSKFRKDNIYGWGVGLDYEIQKWLSAGAEYSHTRRDS